MVRESLLPVLPPRLPNSPDEVSIGASSCHRTLLVCHASSIQSGQVRPGGQMRRLGKEVGIAWDPPLGKEPGEFP